jgi:hypothetical protein
MVKRRSEAGQSLFFLTFGLGAFIAAAGLAIDMGYLRYERRLMQTAADSAAFAAAMDVNLGNASQASADATTVLGTYGYKNGTNNVTVTYTHPYGGNSESVGVQVQQILPTFFMQIFGITSINDPALSATGVASLVPSSGCVYALGAAGLTSTGGIDSPNCGIVDNGTLSGGGTLTASSVGVYGDASGYSGGGTTVEATVQKAADPLAYLTPPTPGTCTAPLTITTTTPLTAGTYCGIIIGTGGIVTFGPGLYILTGNTGLQITGTGTATGTGVTFYNHSTYSSVTATGAITFNGTGSITLSAPTTGLDGLPAGILFYQDTSPAADLSEGGTTGAVTLSGTLYFPSAQITIAGTNNPNANTVIVANSVIVNGSTPLYVDSTSQSVTLPGGSPLISVSLVE